MNSEINRDGESFISILRYWLPEATSITLLVFVPIIFDSYLVANLGSASTYGALGAAMNIIHLIIKYSEALAVASIAIVGRHNGAGEFMACGKQFVNAVWTAIGVGISQFLFFFIFASGIYSYLGVSAKALTVGIPYLKLQAMCIPLTFVFMVLVGFMKGLKNTRVPMYIVVCGIFVFLFFDYALVLGRFGFPQMKLTGSAIATIIRYLFVNLLAIAYIVLNPEYKKFSIIRSLGNVSLKEIGRLLNVCWPIVVDKGALAIAYIWLAKMVSSVGKYGMPAFDIVKNLERIALIPALSFAPILSLLISNSLGAKDYGSLHENVKKVLILALSFVATILLIIFFNAEYFAGLFDPKLKYAHITVPILRVVSIFAIFDTIQITLAGALRGAGDVRTVMWTRVGCFFAFVPISYALHLLEIDNPALKFGLIYCSLYATTVVMGIRFAARICGQDWISKKV